MKLHRRKNTKAEQNQALAAMVDLFARCIEDRTLPELGSPAHRTAVSLAMEAGMHTERGKPQPPKPGFWQKLRGTISMARAQQENPPAN